MLASHWCRVATTQRWSHAAMLYKSAILLPLLMMDRQGEEAVREIGPKMRNARAIPQRTTPKRRHRTGVIAPAKFQNTIQNLTLLCITV